MSIPSDLQLLETFARSRSAETFQVLVDRHLDLVHSIARRVTQNDDLATPEQGVTFIRTRS